MKTITVTKKAQDSDVVHLAGTETITGTKAFAVAPTVPTGVTTLNNSNVASTKWVKNVIDAHTPDYASLVDISDCVMLNGVGGYVYTTPASGWLQITYDFYGTSGASWRILENAYVMWQEKELSDQGYNAQVIKMIPVTKGVKYTVDETKSNTVTGVLFIPVKY